MLHDVIGTDRATAQLHEEDADQNLHGVLPGSGSSRGEFAVFEYVGERNNVSVTLRWGT